MLPLNIEIKKNPKLKDEIRQKYFGSKKYRCKLSNQIIQNVWERVNAAACNSEALIRKLHEQGITFDKLSEFDQQTRRQFYDFITLNLLRYYTLAVFYQGSVSKIFDNGVYVFKSHTSQIKNSFLQFGRQISTGIRSC